MVQVFNRLSPLSGGSFGVSYVRTSTWGRRPISSFVVQHRAEAHAFKLAEDFADFRAITELCYQVASKSRRPVDSGRIGTIDKAALDRRLDYYLGRFKQEFAFELYHWWIEHGEWICTLTFSVDVSRSCA